MVAWDNSGKLLNSPFGGVFMLPVAGRGRDPSSKESSSLPLLKESFSLVSLLRPPVSYECCTSRSSFQFDWRLPSKLDLVFSYWLLIVTEKL
jgi:hypothetical protein